MHGGGRVRLRGAWHLPQPLGDRALSVIFASAGVFAVVAAAADARLIFYPGVGRFGIGRAAGLDHKKVALGLWQCFFGNEGVGLFLKLDFFASRFQLGEEGDRASSGSGCLFLDVEEGDGDDAFGADEEFGLIGCGADEFAAVAGSGRRLFPSVHRG